MYARFSRSIVSGVCFAKIDGIQKTVGPCPTILEQKRSGSLVFGSKSIIE